VIELLQHTQTGTDLIDKMVADICVKNSTDCLKVVLDAVGDFPRDGLFLTTRPDTNNFLPKTHPNHRQHHQREPSAPSRHSYNRPVIALVPAPPPPPGVWVTQQYHPQQYWPWDQQRHTSCWTNSYWHGSG
jgi:hypothetical protein